MYQILLVEDNHLNQLVAMTNLKKLNYGVVVVDDGAQAVEACRDGCFDAVLMDVQMPRMDGLQATKAIREQRAAAGLGHLPIIGLSARAMDGDREAGIAAGFDDYLTKPLRVEDVKNTLHRWIAISASANTDRTPEVALGA